MTCGEQCPKDDTREVRDFHEFQAVQWKEQMNKKQLSQAQQAVDRTLQALVLGLPVTLSASRGGGGTAVPASNTARISITPDLKTLELEQAEGGEQPKQRIPLSQVVDASFGGSPHSLVLRFSEALGRDPLELGFACETVRLQVALTLKVLRARLA